jgi:hypothetical protein
VVQAGIVAKWRSNFVSRYLFRRISSVGCVFDYPFLAVPAADSLEYDQPAKPGLGWTVFGAFWGIEVVDAFVFRLQRIERPCSGKTGDWNRFFIVFDCSGCGHFVAESVWRGVLPPTSV